jgi:hypothetical protein
LDNGVLSLVMEGGLSEGFSEIESFCGGGHCRVINGAGHTKTTIIAIFLRGYLSEKATCRVALKEKTVQRMYITAEC